MLLACSEQPNGLEKLPERGGSYLQPTDCTGWKHRGDLAGGVDAAGRQCVHRKAAGGGPIRTCPGAGGPAAGRH